MPAGWGHHRPSPAAVLAFDGELPIAVDTVLYPYPRDQAPSLAIERLEVVEEEASLPAWMASGLCLQVDDRRDYFMAAHERRALRTCGPVVSDAEVVHLRCDANGLPLQLALLNGSYVELAGRQLVAAEETLRTLELSWAADVLELRAHPGVGAWVWGGDARRLAIDDSDPREIRPVDGQVAVFEDWLD